MITLRILLSYLLVIAGLNAPAPTNAILPNAFSSPYEDMSQNIIKDRVTENEINFLISFKMYIKLIILAQATEVKKKLICLGDKESLELSLDISGNEKKAEIEAEIEKIRNELNSYKNSEECKSFLEDTVPEIYDAYSKMKIHLAIHGGIPHDLGIKPTLGWGWGFAGHGMDFQLSRRQECEGKKNEDEKINCFIRIKEILNKNIITNCDQLKAPLVYDESEFCFENLNVMMDVTPKHLIDRLSIGPIDRLLSNKELPNVAEIPPLTFKELEEATEIYRIKYTRNEYTLEEIKRIFDKKNNSIIDSSIIINSKYSTTDERHMARYYSAKNFQAQGWYLFSDYPEDSAPHIYAKLIAKFPVLAFYRPNIIHNDGEIDCSLQHDFKLICEQYSSLLEQELKGRLSNNFSENHNKMALAEAYKTILNINKMLLDSMDEQLNSEILKNNYIGKNIKSLPKQWVEFMNLKGALDSFLSKFEAFKGDQNRFVELQNSREIKEMILTLGVVIALNVGCGVISGPTMGFVLCLIASGVGSNVYFYNDSLLKYEQAFLEFFSNPGHQNQDQNLTLIEFDKLRTERQALLIETFLIGVGTSPGIIARTTKNILINLLKK